LQVFFPKATTGLVPIGYSGALLSSLLQVNVYLTHNLLNVLVQIANKMDFKKITFVYTFTHARTVWKVAVGNAFGNSCPLLLPTVRKKSLLESAQTFREMRSTFNIGVEG
jgi:hypothetical protein